MNKKKIILASQSFYRKKALLSLGIAFKVIPSGIDESKIKKTALAPEQLVNRLALEKAKIVRQKLIKKGESDFIVIGADSTAVLKSKQGWQYFDKPKNRHEAKKMLQQLRGKRHFFYTGLALLDDKTGQKIMTTISRVYFRNFSEETLEKVLESGIWKGRAGGYDIKGNKSDLIAKFEGSYTNILGMPLEKLIPILEEFGLVKFSLTTGEFEKED